MIPGTIEEEDFDDRIWAAATWAVRFYEKHRFRLVTTEEKNRLLKKYWSIPERQVETSVVLGDERWFRSRQHLVHHRGGTPPMAMDDERAKPVKPQD